MQYISPDLHSTTTRSSRRPWSRRPGFYFLLLGVLILIYFLIGIGFARHTITVDKRPPTTATSLWSRFLSFVSGGLHDTPSVPADPNPFPKQESDRFDVLVMGLRGAGEKEDTGRWLTDTMLVISVDKKNHRASMVSIPRDLYLDMDVPEFEDGFHIKGKINEVYVRGLAKNRGINLAKIVVSKITGVYIDNAVTFDFKAFKDIVDTLGGVDVFLELPFSEKQQWGYEFALPAGNNHLNGEQALYYVRSRYSSSDFDRARRQQQVIDAIKSKATGLGFLSNPLKISSLYTSLKGDITTDFNLWDTRDIIATAESVSSKGATVHHEITTENLLFETHIADGEYVLFPNGNTFDQMRAYFKNSFAIQPISPSPTPNIPSTAIPKK